VVGHLSARDSIKGNLREGSITGECFFFFLEPEDIKCVSLGAIWNFSGVTGLP